MGALVVEVILVTGFVRGGEWSRHLLDWERVVCFHPETEEPHQQTITVDNSEWIDILNHGNISTIDFIKDAFMY